VVFAMKRRERGGWRGEEGEEAWAVSALKLKLPAHVVHLSHSVL
jgi:hypothetical protein